MWILLIVLMLSVCSAAKPGALRVYKGEPDSENEFPFIVLFYIKDVTQFTLRACTGSLIAENWVLTAAHCLSEPDKMRVRYGDFTLPPNETSLHVKIIKTFTPPIYIVRNVKLTGLTPIHRDDIGLVLVDHIQRKYAKLLALDYKTLFGLPVKYAGFGRTASLSNKQVSINVMAKLGVTPLKTGKGILVPCYNIRHFGPQVCVAAKCSNKMQAAHNGDSGGPLVYNGRIIGVTKGSGDQLILLSGAFTPVSIYLEWINQVISSHGHRISIKRRT